jgi:hypothetical protein
VYKNQFQGAVRPKEGGKQIQEYRMEFIGGFIETTMVLGGARPSELPWLSQK